MESRTLPEVKRTMKPPQPNEKSLHCFSGELCGPSEMINMGDGSYQCPGCGFHVQLNARTAPQAWYETWDHPPEVLSKDDPILPFCMTCGKTMVAVACVKGLLYGTTSIFFHCLEGDRIIHRLETYFIKLAPKQFASFKLQIKEAYGLYMIWDLLGRDFDINKILDGPDLVEFDLSRLTDADRRTTIEKFEFMQIVGILLELEVTKEKMRFKPDKDLFRRKAALIAAKPPRPT